MNKIKIKKLISTNIGGWLLMLPSVVLFVFFIWMPLLSNISLSFYKTIGFQKESFVWLSNYIEVFKDYRFLGALKNTLLYTMWSLLIGFLIPIILGILLSEIKHFKAFFRVTLYLPAIIPGIATFIMWKFLYSPESGSALNSILGVLGLGPYLFVDNPTAAIPLIVLTMTWKGAGGTMLIYLATLQTVDNVYYEAARLDGAGAFKRFLHVTLPHILPLIKTLLILQVISVFQVFYEPLVMTGGSLYAMSLMLLNYNYAFIYGNAGMSSALGVLIFIIIVSFTLFYFRVSRTKDEKYERKINKKQKAIF